MAKQAAEILLDEKKGETIADLDSGSDGSGAMAEELR